jgi:Na+/H+ antiporter NhaD/arsenite permease-like protein
MSNPQDPANNPQAADGHDAHGDHHGGKLSMLDKGLIVAAAIGLGLLIYSQFALPAHGHGDDHAASGEGHAAAMHADQPHAGEADAVHPPIDPAHAEGHEAETPHGAPPPEDASADSAPPPEAAEPESAHADVGDAAADHEAAAAPGHEAADHGGEGDHGGHETHAPAMYSIIPFVAILLSIALLPLIPATAHWWEHNRNRLKLAALLGFLTLLYYAFAFDLIKVVHVLQHAVLAEYIPFIVLLFALYVISGGICLKGDLAAHPSTNTAFLAVGAGIASFVGTTGASMLLIRPLLQTNKERAYKKHTVIFFIFLVSNIGGSLLPIGDPPLFLGYLRGVPFLWTFCLWLPWLFTVVILLIVYFVWDTIVYRKETPDHIVDDETHREPLTLVGKLNFLWLLGVVLCVGTVDPSKPFLGTGFTPFPFMRELIMLGLVALSLKFTPQRIRRDNQFNYHAIIEVAALFIGIFICMQAPIEILKASGDMLQDVLKSPAAFFWGTGTLSSFLDNAPTYVVFFETAASMTTHGGPDTLNLIGGGHILTVWLVAISLGAVFMGSMTYIGNGPNFMVKSIAEQSGVKMPSFFGYMVYSVAILVPIFIVVTLIFL